MTPNQIRELQLALNAVAGDLGNFFKVTVLPPGSKVIPQKEMQIVDQADEWIANEVAMTCGVRPTEIGVIPQVSTVASPFAAREMAQAQRSMHDRVDTKPTLKFITEIFDTIIQIVAGQEDMRFLFSGMEEQADKSAAVDAGIKQIQSGAISIDEFRDDLGLTPWGYPETQGPIVFTPMGPIPLFQGVQNALAAQAERPAAAVAAPTRPRTGRRGASRRPSRRARTPQAALGASRNGRRQGAGRWPRSTPRAPERRAQPRARACRSLRPARMTGIMRTRLRKTRPGPPGRIRRASIVNRAALAELEALTRHIKKGRHITTWEPRHLPGAIMAAIDEDLRKGLTAGAGVRHHRAGRGLAGGGAPKSGSEAGWAA